MAPWAVLVEGGFVSYRWFVYITTLMLQEASWLLYCIVGHPNLASAPSILLVLLEIHFLRAILYFDTWQNSLKQLKEVFLKLKLSNQILSVHNLIVKSRIFKNRISLPLQLNEHCNTVIMSHPKHSSHRVCYFQISNFRMKFPYMSWD